MATPIGVGLHIIYGRMGSGKTNFAINSILKNTTYKKCILNVPLTPEFKDTLSFTDYSEFKKLEPEKVIRLIDGEHQDTIFIIDEAQMVLLGSNKLLVESFLKKMSQIRQNNQCVIVIAQISSMLPNDIKKLAEDCYFFENNNVKGDDKTSKVKHYRTGFDYSSRLAETFTWNHVYGSYESTNTPTTEKPQNMYKRTYIKIAVVLGVALVLFVYGGTSIYRFICKYTEDEAPEQSSSVREFVPNITNNLNQLQTSDSLCIRSYVVLENTQTFKVVYNTGIMDYVSLDVFSHTKKCHL